GQEFQITKNYQLRWKAVADASNLLQLRVFPDLITIDNGDIKAGATLGFHSTFSEPLYIFGNDKTTHLKLEQLNIELKVLGSPSDPELQLVFSISGNPGLSSHILFDESDNFLNETIAKQAMEVGFSPEIIWSSKSGITFNGSMSLINNFSLNKEVAGIKFETLFFSLGQGEIKEPSNSVSFM